MAKNNNSKQKAASLEAAQTIVYDKNGSVSSQDMIVINNPPGYDIKRPICAGIDVHKKSLVAAVCITDMKTLQATYHIRTFNSNNSDIVRMAEWFKEENVTDACMESTGKYWYPVYDILEAKGLKPVLTHPKYVRQAKGRKTDINDARNIANLFRMDIVERSFIPPAVIRDLRELCRYRLKLTYMFTSEKNRFQNSMTISKIRIDSIFSDPFGKTSKDIMSYLLNTIPEEVSDEEILGFVRKNIKADDEEILDAIHGHELTGVQRDKLLIIDLHMNTIHECIQFIDEKLEEYKEKYSAIIKHLCSMIGINTTTALYIIGEIGTDMSVWKDCDSLCSWAGLSPANNASAKKKKSTKIGSGGHYLKPLLVQCALAAIKSTKKDPYFHNKYKNISKRRGHKKAIIAIARKMLIAIYHMIRDDKDFCPTDHEKVRQHAPKTKAMDLNSIISYLGEKGVHAETLKTICDQLGEQESKKQPASNDSTADPPKKEERSDVGQLKD